MNKYSKYDECNFEGIWETSVKPYHISLNIHQIRIYFYKRNPKVYRICMNFPEIGTVLFSPVWQRLVNGTMLINLLWKNDKTINFMLRIQDDHLDGNITQDNVIIPISLQRICLKAPSIDDGCLVLSKIWRYELLVYNREYGTYGLDNNEMSFTYSDMNHPLSCNLRTHYKFRSGKKEEDTWSVIVKNLTDIKYAKGEARILLRANYNFELLSCIDEYIAFLAANFNSSKFAVFFYPI